ncbi:MAG: recombinase family protein [Clostridiales bacterium]|jgi:site-specific DNA recombinase|nr:recombinase family protein [Clostridiales bacterium]
MEGKVPERIAIYSRKSKFTGKGESVGNQIEMCKQYIRLHYPHIKEEAIDTYEDEGYSGKNTERPQFQAMLQDGKRRQFDAIVCYRFDRVSRNIKDFADFIQELERLQISFVSIKENFDTTSPMGRAMMYISSVFSQLERETIAERIRDNMRELAKSGRWLGGIPPTGYRSREMISRVTVDGKERKAFQLELIPKEAALVRLIFDTFTKTNSLTQTETYLRQNRILTKNGRDFTRFAIRNILQNPVYLIADEEAWQYFVQLEGEIYSPKAAFDGVHGMMAYSKTVQTGGKTNRLKAVREWILAVGKHQGIVSGKQWGKVQKMLAQNKSKAYRKPKSHVALLSGLLFCGNCGAYLRPKLSSRFHANGERVYDYLCETKEKTRSQHCQMKRPNGNKLDWLVCEQVKRFPENCQHFYKELEQLGKSLESLGEEDGAKGKDLQNERKENQRKIQSLVNALGSAENTAASHYITEQINGLHSRNETLEKQIAELEATTHGQLPSDIAFDFFQEMLQSFAKAFDTMEVEQKREALRRLIQRVVWDGKDAHVFLVGDDDQKTDGSLLSDKKGEPLCEKTK